MAKRIFLYTGIISVIVLGVIIIWRPSPEIQIETETLPSPEELLQLYMTDKMDYSIPFARLLAERRMHRADSLARLYPELKPLALEVMDSLRHRLDRGAE